MKPQRSPASVDSSQVVNSLHSITSRISRVDLLLLLMVLIWGANFAVIKASLEDFHPLSFNAIRFIIASMLLTAVTRVQGRAPQVDTGDLVRMAALGTLANCVYQIAFIEGINLTLAGNTALILGATPVFVTLLSAWRGHEQLGWRSVLGVFASFLGVCVVILSSHKDFQFSESLVGDMLILACTLIWPVYSVGLRPLIMKYGDLECTRLTMTFGTIPLVICAIPSLVSQPWHSVRAFAWTGLFFSAVGAIALCYSIWNYGVRRVGNTRTSSFSNLTQAVTLLVAWATLGERPSSGQLMGMAIIFAGIFLTRRDRKRQLPGSTGI